MNTLSELHSAIKFKNCEKQLRTLSPQNALRTYRLLFPEKSLSRTMLIHKLAVELSHHPEVIRDIVGDDEERLLNALASESSGHDHGLSFQDALRRRDAIIANEGSLDFLRHARAMGSLEAQLFWRSVLNFRPRLITEYRFFKNLSNNKIDGKTIRLSMDVLDAPELIDKIYNTPNELGDLDWSNMPDLHLNSRGYTPWGQDNYFNVKDYNGGYYQKIPRDASVEFKLCPITENKVKMDVWIEGWYSEYHHCVCDVIWPDAPHLNHWERLERYNILPHIVRYDSLIRVQKPQKLPRWSEVIKELETFHIRIPDLNAPFSPYEKGGYMIVKDRHIHKLRLTTVFNEDERLEISCSAMDGYSEINVAKVPIDTLDKKSLLWNKMRRYFDTPMWLSDSIFHIPDDICLVVLVSSPFLDSGMMASPVFIGFDDNAGLSDVEQIVDLAGAPKESLVEVLAQMEDE